MYRILIISTLALLALGCQDPKDKYLEEFGMFINETELDLEEYTDSEWAEIEYSFAFFSGEEFEKHGDKLNDADRKQIELYRERFKKLEVKRNPVENLLKVIGF